MHKSFFMAAAMVIIFTGVAYAGEGDNSAVFSTLAPEKKKFTLGEPIILDFTLWTNTSKTFTFHFGPQGLPGAVQFEVIDKTTGNSTKIPRKFQWDGYDTRMNEGRGIFASENFSTGLVFNRWGSIEAPGNYTIICTVDFIEPEKRWPHMIYARIPECRADVEIAPPDNGALNTAYDHYLATALKGSDGKAWREKYIALTALIYFPEDMAVAAMKRVISSRAQAKGTASFLLVYHYFTKSPEKIIEYYKDANDEQRCLMAGALSSMFGTENDKKARELYEQIRKLPAEIHLSKCKLEMVITQLDNESYAGGPIPIEVTLTNMDNFTFIFTRSSMAWNPRNTEFLPLKFKTESKWENRWQPLNKLSVINDMCSGQEIKPNDKYTFKTYLHYYFANITPGTHHLAAAYSLYSMDFGLLKKMETTFDIHLKEFNKSDLDAKIDKAISGLDCYSLVHGNMDMFLYLDYPGLSRFYVPLISKADKKHNYYDARDACYDFAHLAMRNESALKDLVSMLANVTEFEYLQNIFAIFYRYDFELGAEYVKQIRESGNADLIKRLDQYFKSMEIEKRIKEERLKEKSK
jgi:hypothetical protein